jgi:uncharacterized membrane protein YfcA
VTILDWAILGAGTILAGTLSAVTGFGGAAILLPLLVRVFGVRDAIPILTIAQLIGNGSRAWFNRSTLDCRVIAWFALGAVPAALVGALIFSKAPLPVLTRMLGGFLLIVVIFRHVRRRSFKMPLRAFVPLGAVASCLSALIGSVGPLMAPFFLAFGLVKGAYIGTEAASSMVMHIVKLVGYGGASLLNEEGAFVGLLMGAGLTGGSYLGARIVDKTPERVFVLFVEVTLVISGLRFLLA